MTSAAEAHRFIIISNFSVHKLVFRNACACQVVLCVCATTVNVYYFHKLNWCMITTVVALGRGHVIRMIILDKYVCGINRWMLLVHSQYHKMYTVFFNWYARASSVCLCTNSDELWIATFNVNNMPFRETINNYLKWWNWKLEMQFWVKQCMPSKCTNLPGVHRPIVSFFYSISWLHMPTFNLFTPTAHIYMPYAIHAVTPVCPQIWTTDNANTHNHTLIRFRAWPQLIFMIIWVQKF